MLLWAAARKDLLLQWHGRAHAAAVFAFGATVLLLLSLAAGPDTEALRRQAAGYLWVALLFASVLSLAASFHAEHEQHALEGLLLLPADAATLFFAKALTNWLQLALLGLALVPLMVVLFDAGTHRLAALIGVIVLGTAGISGPGTFYAGMIAQARGPQVLLPLLLLPLVVPVLLAAVKSTSLVLLGDPMGQLVSWTSLLVGFNAVYWPLSGVLFSAAVEE